MNFPVARRVQAVNEGVFKKIRDAKTIIAMYNTLSFLECAFDYEGSILKQGDTVQMRPAVFKREPLCAEFTILVDYGEELIINDVDSIGELTKTAGEKLAYDLICNHPLPWAAFASQIINGQLIYGIKAG